MRTVTNSKLAFSLWSLNWDLIQNVVSQCQAAPYEASKGFSNCSHSAQLGVGQMTKGNSTELG